jgi:hypothetical protein
MIFNKWKKRAYAESEKNEILQSALNSSRKETESLYRTIRVMNGNPICTQILSLKLEAEMANNKPTKLYLSPEKQRDLYNSVGKHLSYAFQGEGSMTMIYGLQVYTTQYNMRVE